MRPRFCRAFLTLLSVFVGLVVCPAAETFQLISGTPPGLAASASANGDSWCPVASGDGRFVLFSSAANNLVATTNNTALPAGLPPNLNVFLRDRAAGTSVLVSVNLPGTAGGNGDSLPAEVSPDGRYALIESRASDLAAGDSNGASDVFVRDLAAKTTILVSVATNGFSGNGASRSAAMTPDGRYVTFVSTANNLVAGDTNGIGDVFVRDVQGGTTTLVSAGARTRPLVSSMVVFGSEAPDITADGRYVAFVSSATNLVPGVPPGLDVYVRDLANNTTRWASAGARAAAQPVLRHTNVACFGHVMSASGRFIAYEAGPNTSTNYPGIILRYDTETGVTDVINTNAVVPTAAAEEVHNLEMTADGRFIAFVANTTGKTGTDTCVRVWDAQTGLTTDVSIDASGQATTNALCDWPAIDPTGRLVAFLSSATNLVTNSVSGEFHLYVRDVQAGSTTLVNVDTNGAGAAVTPATAPRLTSDGRTVFFESTAGSLVAHDRNRASDVFARDVVGGATELISARHTLLASATPNGLSTLSPGSVSSDGRYVAFSSEADDLVTGDTNQSRDVFVRDLATDSLTLVSAGTNGLTGNGVSGEPSISADGRYVAFTSGADNLVAGDSNRWQDVFLRDLQAGTTTLVSSNMGSIVANTKASYSPMIGGEGRYVVFRSRAQNENLMVRDLAMGTNYALTTLGVTASSMSPGSRFVVYITSGKLYVWDLVVQARVYTNSASGISGGALSPNGRALAYWAGSGVITLWMADLVAKTDRPVISGRFPGSNPGLRFDGSGNLLVFTAMDAVNGTNQVYLYDRVAGTSRLVSHRYTDPTLPGNEASDWPDISADGRFVAYRSASADLVDGYTNRMPAIFMFDRQTGENGLLTPGQPGIQASENRSLLPVFSGDGSTLLFQSWSSGLAGGDLNRSSDLFGLTILTALIFRGDDASQGPWLTWPLAAGMNYRVEFRERLDAGEWQLLSGTATNAGTKAWQQDPAPVSGKRFYRIRAN